MTNINQKNIIFYYNKYSLYIKIFALFLICIFFSIIYIIFTFLLFNDPPRILFKFLYIIVSLNIYHIILLTRYISELNRFLEVTSERITYYYYILDPLVSEKDFYWVNIISIEKVYGIFSNKIYIAYKDSYSNKIKKGKIKIHDSEIPYEEIYDTLIAKWNEYKSQNSKVR